MRYIAIALVLLLPMTADAQPPNRARKYVQEVRERSSADAGPSSDDRARQPRNVRPRDQRDQRDHDRWPQTHRPFFKQQPFRHRMPFGSYYGVPSYGYGFGYFGPAAEERYELSGRDERTTPGRVITTGVLRLEITPSTGLEYYVDGLYFGSSSNLGTLLEMNPGPRRIEVRAAGYKPLVFDTRIYAGNETTFRAALEPLMQQPPAQATGNRTMFIIPGCYMGNAPPSRGELRPGCDINKLIKR
jgi:hypothetical protein